MLIIKYLAVTVGPLGRGPCASGRNDFIYRYGMLECPIAAGSFLKEVLRGRQSKRLSANYKSHRLPVAFVF